jgi:hypothetical protein
MTSDHKACCSVKFLFVLVGEGTVALLLLRRSDRVFSTLAGQCPNLFIVTP